MSAASEEGFSYDEDSHGSRDYQRLRHMADIDDFEVNLDWVVNDALHHYELDAEEMLELMEYYTKVVREQVEG